MHSPTKISDPCLTNVLLKINSKLGGINSLLAMEHSSRVPSTVIWEWMPLTGLLVDQIFLLLLRELRGQHTIMSWLTRLDFLPTDLQNLIHSLSYV
ncbi:hypothetical protein ACFX15_023550 [Malus domestica]